MSRFTYRRKFKKKYCKHILEVQDRKLNQKGTGFKKAGQVPEWSNGVDCKSIVRRFKSYPTLKIGDKMKITDLVSKLEKIESKSDGEEHEKCVVD